MLSVCVKLVLVIVILTNVRGAYVPENNIDTSDVVPQETQHAVCKVFTKEIEASAKASITRQLKGVCSSKNFNPDKSWRMFHNYIRCTWSGCKSDDVQEDLTTRFEQLQATMFQELQDIKKALGLKTNILYKQRFNPTSTISSPSSTTDGPSYDYRDYLELDDDVKRVKVENRKSLEHVTRIPDDVNVNDEILMYNDTIVESSEGDLYFYYWTIGDIGKVLKKKNIYVSSPPFSVLGHTMYLQLYPNYMDEFVGILLKPDSNSFLKKHKILFLGTSSTQNVISSKLLYGIKNEDKIFKIEPQMLNRNFIIDDSLLVKLKIYLNS